MRTSKYPSHIPSITDVKDIVPSNTQNIYHIYIYISCLEVRIRPTFGCSVEAQGRCISLDPLSLLQSFQLISLSFRSYSNGLYHWVLFYYPDYGGSESLRNTAVYTISKDMRFIFCFLTKKVGVRFPSECQH